MPAEIAEMQASIVRLRIDGERRDRHRHNAVVLPFIRELEQVALGLPAMSEVERRNEMNRLSDIGAAVSDQIERYDQEAANELKDALLTLGVLQGTEAQNLEAIVDVAATALRLGSGRGL